MKTWLTEKSRVLKNDSILFETADGEKMGRVNQRVGRNLYDVRVRQTDGTFKVWQVRKNQIVRII